MNDENKEELEKKATESSADMNEEKVKGSEEYYDEIDYQQKETSKKVKEKTRKVLREVLDWVLCFVVAYVIYLNINYFLISAPGIKQYSMYPTLNDGERVFCVRPLFMGKLDYEDIITFEAPIDNKYYIDSAETFPTAQYEEYTGLTLFLYKFMDLNKVNYIKRVIGMPGDHIEIKDGFVYRNGEKLEETYVRTSVTGSQEEKYSDVVVPEGTIYVMGDNREASADSRSFGCIPLDRVNGKVVCRIWPLNKLGGIK